MYKISKNLSSWWIFFIAFGSVLIGLLDSIGIALLFPIMSAHESRNSNNKYLNYLFEFLGLEINVLNLVTAIFIIYILKNLLRYLVLVKQSSLTQSYLFSIRKNLIYLFTSKSYEEYLNTDKGYIQGLIVTDSSRLFSSVQQFFKIIELSLLLFSYYLVCLYTNFQFSVIITFSVIIINLSFNGLYKAMKKLSLNSSDKLSEIQGNTIDLISKFMYLKIVKNSKTYIKNLIQKINDYKSLEHTVYSYNAIIASLREPSLFFCIFISIFIQISFFDFVLAELAFIMLIFYRCVTQALALQNSYGRFLNASGSAKKIFNFISTNNKSNIKLEQKQKQNIGAFETLSLNNIKFQVDNEIILKNINLEIKKGDYIAITGPSGSGKTTLLNLISGLVSPSQGSITINGNQNFSLEEFKNNNYSYVTQTSHIFYDSLYNNITLWDENKFKNIEKFKEVLLKTDLIDFYNIVLDSKLDESKISGGQKQRISLAREFYKESELILVDEGTSALDKNTEDIIKESLKLISKSSTLIVVAHRLSTIEKASRIIEMDNGKIIKDKLNN